MDKPTSAQLAKLPKWAQDHIVALERQRDDAQKKLVEHLDAEKESPFRVVDYNSPKPRFIQAHSIEVRWRGVLLTVDAHDYSNLGKDMRISWQDEKRNLKDVAFIPGSFQSAHLVARENMS